MEIEAALRGREIARGALSGALYEVEVSAMSCGIAYGEAAQLGIDAVVAFVTELYLWAQVATGIAAEARRISIDEEVQQIIAVLDAPEPT